MKNNHISNLSKWAMIVTAMILQISCQQDDSFHPTEDSTIINLSVSAANTGTIMDNEESASAIKSLCILQFNVINGNAFGTLRHVGMGTETSSGKYSATLLQSVDNNDKYKLVILANFPDGNYGIFYRMLGKSYAEVQQACLSAELAGESNVLEFTAQQPFPMFGIAKDGIPQIINENMDLGTVSLVRVVARVDIGIGTKSANGNTWSKGSVQFVMTQVQIWKDGKQYAYMPVENNFSSSAGTLTINSPSPVGHTETKIYGSSYIASGTYCAEKIYLPEAGLNWGDVYDANHTNRLAIIVGGKYNGSAMETFYRVDFTNDDSGAKMNILRNHVYQFTIKKVEAAGYGTAELAYNSKPKNLGFEATVEPWTEGQTTSVPSIQGYYLSYQGFNGENVNWTYAVGSLQQIPQKLYYWINSKMPFDYDNFYKEGNKFYFPDISGGQNGELYATVADALRYEGTFPNLMVSGDDMVDESGNVNVQWKTGTTLTAFDLCRNLEEGGYNDWRLPRLSELAFIYVNQGSLTALRGYIPLSGTYWCGSEYLVANATDEQRKKSDWAWAVNFTATTGYASPHQKTEKLKIRCVRQQSDKNFSNK
ncbi:DUF1566 domain-containing protein [Bacteroides thetaiotaomicron]|uniref:Lcl domain-containing protein n=1 Tax=Bacteroides thetaiotaomicron TaxID=818 RepID=UPI001F1B5DCF|nr:DUF1566 domain-containing protein [Bacteroides thetaiotaomicron]MCE8503881.1 DUF1566 domain-containing protein [Bacteroides thetaiotaomicron]